MSLERTVRPFQLPAVTPPALVLDETKQSDPVAVSLGQEGGKTFDYSYSFSGSARSATDNYKEVSRKSGDQTDRESRRSGTVRGDPARHRDQARERERSEAQAALRFHYPDSNST